MIGDIPRILGSRVDPTSYAAATQQVIEWAQKGESRYVCIANVNNIMEAFDSSDYRRIINQADMVTPDGMPLVWTLRALGARNQARVYGPALTLMIAEMAAKEGLPIGLLGSTPDVLGYLAGNLTEQFPRLQINYSGSPPFRPLTPTEDEQLTLTINDSGVRILFVGLGSPKQDRWMAEHKGKVCAVMLGVGAAFDFIAGVKRQAPRWMQDAGLEWFFRLLQEPGRLWRRYLYHNPRFIVLVLQQLLFKRFMSQDDSEL